MPTTIGPASGRLTVHTLSMRRGNGAEWVEWRTGGLFYGLSEEVVMRVAYRLDGQAFAAGKPEMWMCIPKGVLWRIGCACRELFRRAASPRAGRSVTIMTNDPFQVGVVQEINRFTNAQRGHELIDRYAVRGTEDNY